MILRHIDYRGRYTHTTVDIKSVRLANVLLDINKGVEDIEISRAEPHVSSLSPSSECT